MMAKKPRSSNVKDRDASEAPEIPLLPPHDVIINLVREAASTRVRQRALLECIWSGKLDRDSYFSSYLSVFTRDYNAFIAQLMLAGPDFEARFGEWLKESKARYHVPDEMLQEFQSRMAAGRRLPEKSQSSRKKKSQTKQ